MRINLFGKKYLIILPFVTIRPRNWLGQFFSFDVIFNYGTLDIAGISSFKIKGIELIGKSDKEIKQIIKYVR